MPKCGKGCMPECEYFTTGGCISPFNCQYKIETGYINSATSIPTYIPTYMEKQMSMTAEEIEHCLERFTMGKTTDVMNFDYAGTLAYIQRLKAENAALRERLSRAVVLPVKVGDKVYMPWVYDGMSGIAEITAMSITIFDGEFICDTDLESDDINFKQEYSYGQFRDLDFGTKVFTTRKAAEARLAELKGGKE